ncbi:MAG: GNAT family N-acetyltransferase [Chloroflexota bacterium]
MSIDTSARAIFPSEPRQPSVSNEDSSATDAPPTIISAQPDILIRPLKESDPPNAREVVRHLVNRAFAGLPYCQSIDAETCHSHFYNEEPPTAQPVRWQNHIAMAAWRAGQLAGLLDIATGFDADNLDMPNYEPLGLIRSMILPRDETLAEDVGQALLTESQKYWQEAGVGYVRAFARSTGYPFFQAGMGILPSDWSNHIRVLTSHEYTFQARFYRLRLKLGAYLEEEVPMVKLSLVLKGTNVNRQYEVYQRAVLIGSARYIFFGELEQNETGLPRQKNVAHLLLFNIEDEWRGHHIGRWLLRRMVNDATLQGYHEMIVHVEHNQDVAMRLFAQHGFEELNYRGYTLQKVLTH